MNLLLDTHVLIWTATDDPRLSETAREMILDADNAIYYSAVSIWEIALKHSNHPDNVEFTGKQFSQLCKDAGFLPIEMRDKHVCALETLSRPENAPRHQDPFDRMLIAQAKAENMTFLTHDVLLSYYDEKCVMLV